MSSIALTPELLLHAYAKGLFPMAQGRLSGDIGFYQPEMRGQLSITDIHIPKNLLKKLKQAPFEVHINKDFCAVIEACAQPREDAEHDTWINTEIVDAYCALNEMGHAHSVECWDKDQLAGGLYGVSLGGMFAGESMFTRATDASKIALIHLCARLWKAEFEILDTQFTNPHLEQFGVYEIPHAEYMQHLLAVLDKQCDFTLGSDQDQSQILMAYLQMRQNSQNRS